MQDQNYALPVPAATRSHVSNECGDSWQRPPCHPQPQGIRGQRGEGPQGGLEPRRPNDLGDDPDALTRRTELYDPGLPVHSCYAESRSMPADKRSLCSSTITWLRCWRSLACLLIGSVIRRV